MRGLRNLATGLLHTRYFRVKSEKAGVPTLYKLFPEVVTHCDLEGPAVQDDFHPHIKVIHCIVALIMRGGKGDTVTANQCTCVCAYECVSESAGWTNLTWR